MKKNILVIGSSFMELSLNMEKLPAPGETVTDDGGVAYLPGGVGAEAAIALSRLGMNVTFISKLGADSHGKKLYEYFKEKGLDTSSIKVDPDYPTGLSVKLRESTGEIRTLVYPGSNLNLSVDNISSAFDRTAPDAVFLGFDIPFATALAAARIADSRGIPIFIDPALASEDHTLELLPRVEIFMPSDLECKTYTGILPAGTDISLRASLSLYRKLKCKYLVLTLGQRGSFLYDGKRCDVVAPLTGIKIPEGASALGSAYAAALVASYLLGEDIKSSMKFATASAALTGTRGGGLEALPTYEEVLAFVRQRGG